VNSYHHETIQTPSGPSLLQNHWEEGGPEVPPSDHSRAAGHDAGSPPKKQRIRWAEAVGRTFGRLTVLSVGKTEASGQRRVACQCTCGQQAEVSSCGLATGHTTSCGCFQLERTRSRHTTHGQSGSPEFWVWWAMWQRTGDVNHPSYDQYGGRGVSVCAEWGDFACFFADMGPRPSSAHSLDRIDNNAGYCRENCRWATKVEQANNMRSNRFLEYGGQRMTVASWTRYLGWPKYTLISRLKLGWTPERALTQTPQNK